MTNTTSPIMTGTEPLSGVLLLLSIMAKTQPTNRAVPNTYEMYSHILVMKCFLVYRIVPLAHLPVFLYLTALLCIAAFLPAYRSVYLSICLSVCLSVCLSIFRSACCLSTCLPVNLSACLPACLPFGLSVCLPVCLGACLTICLLVRLSVCLPACLSVCVSAY